MMEIIAFTPKGAEAERGEAIRSGASVAEFREILAAFTILDAVSAAQGA